ATQLPALSSDKRSVLHHLRVPCRRGGLRCDQRGRRHHSNPAVGHRTATGWCRLCRAALEHLHGIAVRHWTRQCCSDRSLHYPDDEENRISPSLRRDHRDGIEHAEYDYPYLGQRFPPTRVLPSILIL